MSNSISVFIQPRPFYMIFFLEMWERFGYYGVQAILAVYFVHQLGYSESKASIVFGAFSSLVFALVSIGGKLGDSYLGTKVTMMLGAVTLAIGYFLLGLSGQLHILFFIGLGFVAAGNGLFKANPSSLLARCYERGDPRLDGAFTMYYMSVNIGSMISMFLVPYLAITYSWSIGFYVCTFGLIIAILTYTLMRGSVAHIGSKADMKGLNKKRLFICIVGTIISVLICTWLLQNVFVTQIIMYIIGAIILVIYMLEIFKLHGKDKMKMAVSLILIIEALLFFILYMQMPTSLNFFAIHNVHHNLLGIPIAPESFQTLNPIWIVIASPIMAYIYNNLGSKNRDLSMPMKFAVGMVLCSLAFLILPFAITTANAQGIISSYWLIISYGFQSIGELLVSGLGLSMIAQLVPSRLRGFLMGAWFLSTSFAAIIAGHVASLAGAPASKGHVNPLETLPMYSHVFMLIGIWAGIIAILMLITAPLLGRIISENT